MVDDELVYEIYDEERPWYTNIEPKYLMGILLLNAGVFLWIYQTKQSPLYYILQIAISITFLYFLGINKSQEAENKLKREEAIRILHSELYNKEYLEGKFQLTKLPNGEPEYGNSDPVRSPHDNKIIAFRIGFGIRDIKGIIKHFLAEVSADKIEKGYGIGLVGLHSLPAKYKGEFIVYKAVPVITLHEWKDWRKLNKIGEF